MVFRFPIYFFPEFEGYSGFRGLGLQVSEGFIEVTEGFLFYVGTGWAHGPS